MNGGNGTPASGCAVGLGGRKLKEQAMFPIEQLFQSVFLATLSVVRFMQISCVGGQHEGSNLTCKSRHKGADARLQIPSIGICRHCLHFRDIGGLMSHW